MKSNHKESGISMVKAVAFGTGIFIAVMLTLCAGFAALISSEKMEPNYIGYIVCGVLLLSALAGGWAAIGKWNGSPLMICGITALAEIACLLCCGIVFFDGKFQNVPVTMLLLAGSTMTPGLLLLKKNNKKAHGKIRYKIR